ncbi:cell division protein ZipA [Halospina denitrificans]|uniref:Cell division protein ZipA n=1 Tax=Halospina denitrificans TaxID=332522 RepID=A0A4R7JUQ6_9GAMM|nr:cell division protein ZipA [Halospina denitrificans]TDT41596.1 cell division protein ZipA [Halospina denitrificans]
MSLREWLIIIGALLILGVIVDGLRRMHRARQESLEIARGMGSGDIGQTPIDDDYNSELPNGGARPVGGDRPSASEPRREPTLSDNVEAPSANATEASTATSPRQSSGGATAETESITASDDDGILGPARVHKASETASDPETGDDGARSAASGTNAGQLWQKIRDGAARVGEAAMPSEKESPEATTGQEASSATEPEQATAPASSDEPPLAGANRPEAEEVVVVNVHCRGEDRYQGRALQKLLDACGMEFGDLGIYHRHEEPDTRSPVQFSVASAVAPGTLRPEEMETLETPGVSFFMSLPGPRDPVQAFDFMLETAQALARNLGGELRDENHSVMTTQTIEHCRQRIREYERKRRSAIKA